MSLSPRVRDGSILLAGLVVALVALQLSGLAFWQGLAITLAIFIVLTVSLNLANGFTGVFTLGQIGFMALGAYISAILTLPQEAKAAFLPDLPGWLAGISLDQTVGWLPVGWLAATLIAALAGERHRGARGRRAHAPLGPLRVRGHAGVPGHRAGRAPQRRHADARLAGVLERDPLHRPVVGLRGSRDDRVRRVAHQALQLWPRHVRAARRPLGSQLSGRLRAAAQAPGVRHQRLLHGRGRDRCTPTSWARSHPMPSTSTPPSRS